MESARRRFRSIGAKLRTTGFLPLLLCSLLACTFLALRRRSTGVYWYYFGYYFLSWDLFLAWAPYFCALWVDATARRRAPAWHVALAGVVWLLFYPNAPYLVTDIVHFGSIPGRPWWWDVGMLVTFAWSGLLLAVVSLRIVHRRVRAARGAAAGWVFVGAVALLSGGGIYIGRFLKWNSWDVATHPRRLATRAVAGLMLPSNYPRAAGVTLMYSAILLVCYVSFTMLTTSNSSGADA